MAGNGGMNQTDRLLQLMALFWRRREPISFERLMEWFPEDYGQKGAASARRMFERDKAALAQMGIALDYVAPRREAEAEAEGYRLRRGDEGRRAAIGLQVREAMIKAGEMALKAGCLEREALKGALHKLRLMGEAPLGGCEAVRGQSAADLGRIGPWTGEVERIWRAIVEEKRLTIRYATAADPEGRVRDIDPWWLVWERGDFSLGAFCHLRGAARTFRLGRVREVRLCAGKSPPFVAWPKGRRVERSGPSWRLPCHEPVEVVLSLGRPLLPLAGRLFPGGRRVPSQGRAAWIALEATCLDNLIAHVVRHWPLVRVIAPAEAVARVCSTARAALMAHREELSPGMGEGAATTLRRPREPWGGTSDGGDAGPGAAERLTGRSTQGARLEGTG